MHIIAVIPKLQAAHGQIKYLAQIYFIFMSHMFTAYMLPNPVTGVYQ